MTANLQGIERVAPSVRDAVQRYADILTELAGDELAGLTLYGPVLTESFDASRHTVRNVAVFPQVNLDLLRELAGNGPRLAKLRMAAPIIMTPSYVEESLDTFPLELLEIQLNHATWLGDDYFENFAFDPEHIRLQSERELNVLLVGMRQGLLASGGKAKLLGHLADCAAETLVRTLQGLLWLRGERRAMEPLELIEQAEGYLQRKLPAVHAIVASQAGRGWDQFVSLYQELEVLRETVDAS